MQVTGRECYGARGGRVQGHYCLMEIKNNERKELKGGFLEKVSCGFARPKAMEWK